MYGPRKKLKLFVTSVMTIFVFVVVEVSRNSGRSKRYSDGVDVLVPGEPFWGKGQQQTAFWNLLQQKLDRQNNPILNGPNATSSFTSGPEPDWFENTITNYSCEPDLGVATHVKDYNLLPERFKDFLQHMRCRTYPILVDLPEICKEPPFLLLAVKSLAPHFDRRQAIRESWGRMGTIANRTVVTVFLLGNAAASDNFPDLSDMLRYEISRHNDILQWDYRDSFFNLTMKEVLFLEWFSTRCSGAKFVLKGDDDVFVNTLRILNFLAELSPDKARDLFVGDVITNATPLRDKKLKYFIPESLYTGAYPPYAGGGGYLFSGDIALRLHGATAKVALYPIDDVYTGMCLRKLGLTPTKHGGFFTFDIDQRFRKNPCAYWKLMLVHQRSPQDIIKIWAWINDPALKCR